MKKTLIPALLFAFIMGISVSARAQMRYGPLVLDSAAVLAKKTFEVTGFYNHAAGKSEVVSPPKALVAPDGKVTLKTMTTEYNAPISALNGAVSYGLSDIWEIGISRSKVSRDYLASLTVNASSKAVTTIGNVSGWSDTVLKAKVGNGQVAGTFLVYVPNGKTGISPMDNDMDYGLKLALSPESRGHAKFHLNLGLTKWGKQDTPQNQSTTIDAGMALEMHWSNGYSSSTGGSWTLEMAGNTQKNEHGLVPFDMYTGLKVDTSKNFQLDFVLGLGLSKGSSIGLMGLGYGVGFKWLIGA